MTEKKRTPMKVWMENATTEEQKQLCEMAETSRGYLYQLAGGFRSASAELAARVEEATKVLAKSSKGRLPVVYRTDLSKACSACHFARKCIGPRAEFDLL
jgi:hypothetical protein